MKPQHRYHLANGTHFIQAPYDQAGKAFLHWYRATYRQFKRRRIRGVLQMRPDEVPFETVMPLT